MQYRPWVDVGFGNATTPASQIGRRSDRGGRDAASIGRGYRGVRLDGRVDLTVVLTRCWRVPGQCVADRLAKGLLGTLGARL